MDRSSSCGSTSEVEESEGGAEEKLENAGKRT